jgi:hypothetical protein
MIGWHVACEISVKIIINQIANGKTYITHIPGIEITNSRDGI